MKLARYSLPDGGAGVGRIDDDRLIPLRGEGPTSLTLAVILEADDPQALAESLAGPASSAIPLDSVSLLPPIDQQEVWAAGVTYKRSRSARMEESAASASCYDRVYSSPRPELFMKATPHRVSGPGQPLRIRGDSKWNVPEPELTLVISSRKFLVGFTVGNDMSSRDIEGENPLYLPQAKVYDNCCGLGPWITLAGAMPPPAEIGIRLEIRRAGTSAFTGETSVAQMARSFENLIGWLGRDNSFPTGVFLLTGTGVVPPSDFTLQAGDEVSISIDGIGTLTNPIVQGPANAE
jgi:2-dehydro-3-deoxy-D-arabinonate dehydratase